MRSGGGGGTYSCGPSEEFYRDLFMSKNLIDIKPTKLVPTWRNGRTGPDAVARRLDRCLVAEELLSTSGYIQIMGQIPIYIGSHTHFLTTRYFAYPQGVSVQNECSLAQGTRLH
jgi:hypothetical protein